MGIYRSLKIYVGISTCFLSLPLFVDAAIHRITHDDSRVSYIPSTCDLACHRVCRNQWWLSCLSDGTASHRTKGNNTSSNFSFQGSSITWYTRTANDGGKAQVYIDEVLVQSIDTNSPVVNEANPVFTKSGLDPTKPHTISVLYDIAAFTDTIERFVDVRYFEYDDGGDTGVGSSGPSQNPLASASSTSTVSSSANGLSSSSSTSTVSTTTDGTTRPASTPGPVSLSPILVTFSNGTVQTIAVNGSSANVPSPASNTLSSGTITGIVFGVAAVLCIFALCFLFGKRRQRRAAAVIDYSRQGSNSTYPSATGTQSRPLSLVSRSHNSGGDPFPSTDTFFRNIRNSHFYTLRNPEARTTQPILYSDASTSKRRLAQYSHPNLPELHTTNGETPMHSLPPRPPSQSYEPSEADVEDSCTGARTDYVPASLGSGTRMTHMSQDSSRGAHAYSMTQDPMNYHGNRSSGGSWLPSTPPPRYIR